MVLKRSRCYQLPACFGHLLKDSLTEGDSLVLLEPNQEVTGLDVDFGPVSEQSCELVPNQVS